MKSEEKSTRENLKKERNDDCKKEMDEREIRRMEDNFYDWFVTVWNNNMMSETSSENGEEKEVLNWKRKRRRLGVDKERVTESEIDR